MSNLDTGVELITEKQLSKEQKAAVKLVLNKRQNIFIQGQAGTGKSAFIKYLQGHTERNIVLCSPTAIAALNIGGVTLHSLFKLPIMDFITDYRLFKMNRKNVWSVIKAIDILIIDEISMVRPDILDAVDKVCKKIRYNNKPFGGIQVILIGDLYQLPPIVKKETLEIFKMTYNTEDPYFFDADSYKLGNFKRLEFTKVFRQLDKTLLKNLKRIRENKETDMAIKYFNTCKISNNKKLSKAVVITPYKAVAEEINNKKLTQLSGKAQSFNANLSGTFIDASEAAYPTQKTLKLKEGALVIFNKNDKDKRWINGSVGIIKTMDHDILNIQLVATEERVLVQKETWENKEYIVTEEEYIDEETGEHGTREVIEEKVIGEFKQFPIQLGYAMTIHKAQGKTLDCVNIDLDRGAFAHGQLYVALSRTRNKEDMNIVSKITAKDIIFNERIKSFLNA